MGGLPKSGGAEGNEGNEGVFWTVQAIQVSHNVSRCFLELIVIYICPRIKKSLHPFCRGISFFFIFPLSLLFFLSPKVSIAILGERVCGHHSNNRLLKYNLSSNWCNVGLPLAATLTPDYGNEIICHEGKRT